MYGLLVDLNCQPIIDRNHLGGHAKTLWWTFMAVPGSGEHFVRWMTSPTFNNWEGLVPEGLPEPFKTARLVGRTLRNPDKDAFTKAARSLANLAWFLDARQYQDLLDLENGRSSVHLLDFQTVMRSGNLRYNLIPTKPSSLVMKRNGVAQLNLPTPQQMTFDHSHFVAFHMFQGPGRWLREQGVDPRWRTHSPDHAQFYEDHFHNHHLGRLPGFLVFDESNPANRRNDLRLTDWMAMVLSGGMNPHRHCQPATPNCRKSSPSLVEPRVVCIVRAELAQENNPNDVTVHFLIHPPHRNHPSRQIRTVSPGWKKKSRKHEDVSCTHTHRRGRPEEKKCEGPMETKHPQPSDPHRQPQKDRFKKLSLCACHQVHHHHQCQQSETQR